MGANWGNITGQNHVHCVAVLDRGLGWLIELGRWLVLPVPLYVLMGALLNRLPLADRLFRCGVALGGRSGASLALSTLGWARCLHR